MQIKTVGLILKKDSEKTRVICDDIIHWLKMKDLQVKIDSISPDLDILIILGGDGTLLHVANQASRYGIPVVGVNLGDLGFLTEVAVDERFHALEKILHSEFEIEERMMLKVRLCKTDGDTPWSYALNDVVISKGTIDRLVRLSTWADEEYITTYKADGLVFSTPTGSTAYNLSAGGPIIRPDLQSIVVTPICPFMLESRPVLLPPHVRLNTKVAGPVNDVKVIIDGQSSWDMHEDDILEIVAAEKPLLLISSPNKGYFEILRSKLNWGGVAHPDLTKLSAIKKGQCKS